MLMWQVLSWEFSHVFCYMKNTTIFKHADILTEVMHLNSTGDLSCNMIIHGRFDLQHNNSMGCPTSSCHLTCIYTISSIFDTEDCNRRITFRDEIKLIYMLGYLVYSCFKEETYQCADLNRTPIKRTHYKAI